MTGDLFLYKLGEDGCPNFGPVPTLIAREIDEDDAERIILSRDSDGEFPDDMTPVLSISRERVAVYTMFQYMGNDPENLSYAGDPDGNYWRPLQTEGSKFGKPIEEVENG